MQLFISGHHMNNGESLESFVEEKLQTNVKKYFKTAITADVKFNKDHGGFIQTTITINDGTGHHFESSQAEAKDAYESFNTALKKVVTQLRRYSDRMKEHKSKHPHNFDEYVA